MTTCSNILIDVAPTDILCFDAYDTNTKVLSSLDAVGCEMFYNDYYIPNTTGSFIDVTQTSVPENEDSDICFSPLFGLFQKCYSEFIIQEEFINHINTSNFFVKLGRVYSQASIDDTLDFIFKTIDKMLLDGEFNLIDKILSHVIVENFSIDILLSIATVTFPWRHKLSCRDNYIQKIKFHLEKVLPIEEAKEISYYL